MDKATIQLKIFQIMSKSPPVCVELSPIDIFYICRGLILWLGKSPNTRSVKKLFGKMWVNLTKKFPQFSKEIIDLLPDN